MKIHTLPCIILFSLFLIGCEHSSQRADIRPAGSSQPAQEAQNDRSATNGDLKGFGSQAKMQQVSLNDAEQSNFLDPALDRKIISSADLTLEVAAPASAQQKISSLATAAGGFIITSEAKQEDGDQAKQELRITIVVRVPARQFDSALNQIRSVGSRVIQEKITGQDVTEEFIDLEARIKTQKALEMQFLEIMKHAAKVTDALEVQRQIADVRTEIEKLEGRKRFLENRTSLSTITVNLQPPAAIVVNTSSFSRSIRETVVTSMDLATGIVLLLIRLVIVMIPILVLLVLPAALVGRYLSRRAKRLQLARELQSAAPLD